MQSGEDIRSSRSDVCSSGLQDGTIRGHIAGAWRVSGSRAAWLLLAIAMAFAVTLRLDIPIAYLFVQKRCCDWLDQPLNMAEVFGHGFGIAVICLLIYQLDPLRRRHIARLLTTCVGAGLLADVLKLTVLRVRPKAFDFHGNVWDTFQGFLPFLSGGPMGQSFPSGHTAVAVGMAFALTWLYPRGRLIYCSLAVLVACQRVVMGYHFPSDTLCGAVVGWGVAAACLKHPTVVAAFDRWEYGRTVRVAALDRRDGLSMSGDCEMPTTDAGDGLAA